jgi:hypothetical protein
MKRPPLIRGAAFLFVRTTRAGYRIREAKLMLPNDDDLFARPESRRKRCAEPIDEV